MRLIVWKTKAKKAEPEEKEQTPFEVYCEEFEKRRRVKLPSAMRKSVKSNVEVFAKRVGADVAVKAIRTVFRHPKCRWISGHDTFLANKGNYERHVQEFAEESQGEQAQFRGERSEEPGVKPW